MELLKFTNKIYSKYKLFTNKTSLFLAKHNVYIICWFYFSRLFIKVQDYRSKICWSNYILNLYPNKYSFKTNNQKYSTKIIVTEIIYFLKCSISYENYRGPMSSKTLNRHILFLSKEKIFEKVYHDLYQKYISKNTYSEAVANS